MSDPFLVPATPNKLVVFPTGMGEDITPEIDDRILVGDKSDGWKGKWMSMRKLPTGGFHGTWETIYEMLGSGATQGQYGYLRVNDAYYPMFCTNSNSTAIESWFAVTGFTSVLPATTPGWPVITSTPFKVFPAGKFVTYQITATNNPLNYSATGLPPGLSCNPVTGLISGELAASGLDPSYTTEITATNFLGSGSLTTQFDVSNELLLDVLQVNSKGYALFKLREGYTGSCINVRNSAGVELGIGFDASGWVDMAAISSHCGAGDGFVTKLYDQSAAATPTTSIGNPGVSSLSPLIYVAGEPIMFNGRPALWNPYSDSDESAIAATMQTDNDSPVYISDVVCSFVPTDLREFCLISYNPGINASRNYLGISGRAEEAGPIEVFYPDNGVPSYVQGTPDTPATIAAFSLGDKYPTGLDPSLGSLKTLRVAPTTMAGKFFGLGKSRTVASVGHSFRGYLISLFFSPEYSNFTPTEYSRIYNEIESRYSL